MIINKLLNIFPILFYPFVNILILIFLGFGLTYLIIPKYFRPFIIWLSPWTTIIISIFYFVVASLFGLSVRQVIIPFVIILSIVTIIVILRQAQYDNLKYKLLCNFCIKENLILAIFVGLTLILNLSPLIRHDKMLTSVSMGNNDIIAYTTVGDYLKDHSIAESFKTEVEETISNLLGGFRRLGTPIINSFFLTILNLQAYQYSYISQAVLFSLFLPLTYILFKILFGRSSIVGLTAVSVFTGFNVNLLYMLYHNFFGQVLSWGIAALLFIFFYHYFNSQQIKLNKFNRYDFILGIIITVLYFSYHESAVFMFAPLIIFLAITFIFKKKLLRYYLIALLKIAFISFATGFKSIIYATVFDYERAFMYDPNQPIGWQLFRGKVPYANSFEAMGFWSIHNFEPMPIILAIVLSVSVILIIIKGVLKSRVKILTISYLSIFTLFFYWTGFSQHNFFTYNRALTYILPFIIVIFSTGLTILFEKQKYFWSVIIVILISLELWSAVNLNKRFIREHLSVEKSYISILNLKDKKIKEPIYTESFIKTDMPLWMQIWTNYFLYSKSVSTVPTIFNDSQFQNKIPNNSLVLISKPTPWYKPAQVLLNNIVWENEYYKLGRICNEDNCLIKSSDKLNEIKIGKNNYEDSLLISGWGISEGDTRWANQKESTLRLTTKQNYPKSLTISALSLGKPQEMTVYLDDKLLGKISLDTEWKKYNLPINYRLSPNIHKVKFVYSNDYRPMDIIPNNLDNRTLYVNFKEIKVE